MTSSHSSSERLNSIRSRVMPALLTTMSRLPSPSAAATMASAVDALPHVTLDDRDLAAAGADLVGGVVGSAGQVVEHHSGTGIGQGERLGAPETGPGAGDDRYPTVQARRG